MNAALLVEGERVSINGGWMRARSEEEGMVINEGGSRQEEERGRCEEDDEEETQAMGIHMQK